MARVLVTGGAGFIGRRTVQALLHRGYSVRVLDRLAEPVHRNGAWPPDMPSDVELIRGDVRSASDLRAALDEVDRVIHLAAYQDYLPDFSTFIGTNAQATALLYELIVSDRLPITRIVIASSQAVYGEGAYECEEHGRSYPNTRTVAQLRRAEWELPCPLCRRTLKWLPTDESRANPQNPYGISKLTQELLGLQLGRRYDVPSVALRYSITQGAGQSVFNAYSGICRIFTSCALEGRPLPIYEDGGQVRDYVHVDDVVAANLLALEDSALDYEVFNVGGRQAHSVLEYAAMVRDITQVDLPLLRTAEFRVGDTRHIVSDSTKLRRHGWTQTKNVMEIISEYVAWARSQPVNGIAAAALDRMRRVGTVELATARVG